MTEPDITIKLNGRDTPVPRGSTIQSFLDARQLRDRLVVVELNGTIVNRAAFPTTPLSSDDQVEIVHFVGGG